MRFILKAAFFLGLLAFFMPFGDRSKDANISMMGAFVGAQQAIADLTGFCDRAPQACDTGKELAVFAGERITDGAALAYSLVQDKLEARNDANAAHPPTDPVNTGALAAGTPQTMPAAIEPARGPQPYMPPRRMPVEPPLVSAKAETPQPEAPTKPQHSLVPAIPTPAPRV